MVKKFEPQVNRVLIGLRSEVIDARSRWEKLVLEHRLKKKVFVPERGGGRGSSRIIYLVHLGEWWEGIRKEIDLLQAKIKRAGLGGVRKPRGLWLPTIIENPVEIEFRVYPAISSRKNVGKDQARAFARKAGCASKFSDLKFSDLVTFKIKSRTGWSYKLVATHESGKKSYSFTEWVVCVVSDKDFIPKFKKTEDSVRDDHNFEGAFCTYNKSALYVSRVDSQ